MVRFRDLVGSAYVPVSKNVAVKSKEIVPVECSFLNKDKQDHSVRIFHEFSCLYISAN